MSRSEAERLHLQGNGQHDFKDICSGGTDLYKVQNPANSAFTQNAYYIVERVAHRSYATTGTNLIQSLALLLANNSGNRLKLNTDEPSLVAQPEIRSASLHRRPAPKRFALIIYAVNVQVGAHHLVQLALFAIREPPLRLCAGHRGLPKLLAICITHQTLLRIVQVHHRYSHPGTMSHPPKITRKKPCVLHRLDYFCSL